MIRKFPQNKVQFTKLPSSNIVFLPFSNIYHIWLSLSLRVSFQPKKDETYHAILDERDTWVCAELQRLTRWIDLLQKKRMFSTKWKVEKKFYLILINNNFPRTQIMNKLFFFLAREFYVVIGAWSENYMFYLSLEVFRLESCSEHWIIQCPSAHGYLYSTMENRVCFDLAYYDYNKLLSTFYSLFLSLGSSRRDASLFYLG